MAFEARPADFTEAAAPVRGSLRWGHHDIVHVRAGKLRLIIRAAAILVGHTVDRNRRARGRKGVNHRSDRGGSDGGCGGNRGRSSQTAAVEAATVVIVSAVNVDVPIHVDVLVYVDVPVDVDVLIRVDIPVRVDILVRVGVPVGVPFLLAPAF